MEHDHLLLSFWGFLLSYGGKEEATEKGGVRVLLILLFVLFFDKDNEKGK